MPCCQGEVKGLTTPDEGSVTLDDCHGPSYHGRMKRFQRGLFVTGTDTGVGKSVVAAGLLEAWRAGGVDAVPMKPVQTGCRLHGGVTLAPDLEYCLRAARLNPRACDKRDMAPYAFPQACSPHLAARLNTCTIRIPVIVNALQRLLRRHEKVVVEGAGGILVPLDTQVTMLDLMQRLKLPVVLVARAGLGTLNHTFLSLEVLQRGKLDVVGIVLNQAEDQPWGRIETDNLRTIEARHPVPVVVALRHGATPAQRLRALAPLLASVS